MYKNKIMDTMCPALKGLPINWSPYHVDVHNIRLTIDRHTGNVNKCKMAMIYRWLFLLPFLNKNILFEYCNLLESAL